MQKEKAKKSISIERPLYLKRILIAFAITCVIFFILFYITISVNYIVSQKTDKRINDFERNMEKIRNLSNNLQCNFVVEQEAKNILNDAVYKIGFLEEKFGKGDARVLEQKEYYSKLQYEHYLLLNELNKKCKINTVILFFIYDNSNNEELREKTDKMSFILGNYYAHNKEEIMLYSMDYNLNIEIINKILNENNITHAPVILNIETGYTSYPENVNELEEFVEEIKNETK